MLAFHSPHASVSRAFATYPKRDRPPVLVTYLAFRLMVGLGMLLLLIAIIAWIG